MGQIESIRAEEEWQRAGAYSVRIQGMNRQHHISLREEFDQHDRDGTKYIVLLEDGYPFATCRFYETNPGAVTLGRVVVLPEYRGKHFGRRVLEEAEQWISDLGYKEIIIDSRIEVIPFYEKAGYRQISSKVLKNEHFECVTMHKVIGETTSQAGPESEKAPQNMG